MESLCFEVKRGKYSAGGIAQCPKNVHCTSQVVPAKFLPLGNSQVSANQACSILLIYSFNATAIDIGTDLSPNLNWTGKKSVSWSTWWHS
jgi:hypothetical protein